ncbi:MAG: LicD family protein [Prevotella sp.]|nr:LicD family protein [Bacteroides sp.]MCM1366850.1 LicD family protein [Prevotella sp.]MCM1437424.1 LicD family protein [Prevotella sp.]
MKNQRKSINDTLRETFNPDGSTLRNHQIHLLGMLKKFDDYCRVNGIEYMLSSGTVLGAARHGGFIPWDDDLDVEMSASQYRKLRKLMIKNPPQGIAWQDWKNEPLYVQPFGKLRDTATHIHEADSCDNLYKYNGHYIDVFPLYPSNSRKIANISRKIQNTLQYRLLNLNPKLRKILLPAAKQITHRLVYPAIRLISSIGAGKRLRHTPGTAFAAPRYSNHLFPTALNKFEDTIFPMPGNVDAYLRLIYGDYMTLPNLDNLPSHLKKD